MEEAVEVPPEITREGIARGVGIHLRHLTQYVRPLAQEGLVREWMAHVRGIRQRRKVYALTDAGRMEAIRLRRRVDTGPITVRDSSGVHRAQAYLAEAQGVAPVPAEVDFSQEVPPVKKFYGRRTELEDVRQALAEVPFVLVAGIAGVGKTAMGAKIRDELRGHRALFWRRIQTWDSATDLLRSLATFLRNLGRPELSRQLQEPEATDLGRTEALLRADLTGLESLLIFDDLQNASEDCLTLFQVLLRVLRRTHPHTWTLMLTREVPRLYSRRDVSVDHSVEEFILKGLSGEASLDLLTDSEVPTKIAPRLAELAGGHPLFLKLLGASQQSEAIGSGLHDLETYVSEEVVPDLDENARACMETVSFFEVPVPSEGVLLATGGGKETLFRLQRKGLLDFANGEIVAVHDRIRAYFREGLPPERKEALLAKIVPWMLEEARRRNGDKDFEGAVALLENVVTIEADPSRLRAALERLGLVRRFIGDPGGAIEAHRQAIPLASDPEEKAWLHRAIAETLPTTWDVDEMAAELLEAEKTGLEGPSRERASILFDQAWVALLRGTPEMATDPLEKVSSWLPTLPRDPYLIGRLAHSKGYFHLYAASLYDPHASLDELRTAGAAYRELADSRSDAEDSQDERAGLRHEEDRFWRMNAVPWILALMGEAAVSLGRVDEGLSLFDEATLRDKESGFFGGRLRAPLLKVRVLTRLGRFDEAEELLERILPRAKQFDPRYKLLHYYRYLSDLYYWEGHLQEAREALESWYDSVVPFAGTNSVNQWNLIERLALLANMCTQLDDLDAAEGYARKAEGLAADYPSEEASALAAFAQASLLAARGVIGDAGSHFRQAATYTPRWTHSAPTRGWILLEYGKFLAANARKQEARSVLREAQEALPWRHEPMQKAIEEVLASLN